MIERVIDTLVIMRDAGLYSFLFIYVLSIVTGYYNPAQAFDKNYKHRYSAEKREIMAIMLMKTWMVLFVILAFKGAI